MHVQRDARVTLDEAFDYVGQGVASTGMRGGDVQRAFVRVGVFTGDGFDGVHLGQHFTCDANDFSAGRGDWVRCLPLRAKIWMPSSSSSMRTCLLMPGCEV